MCPKTNNNICNNLLFMEIEAKSVFNILYVRIIFNQQINISKLTQQNNLI
jgi:hypothetical protein